MVLKDRVTPWVIGAVILAGSIIGCDPNIPERDTKGLPPLEVIFDPETGTIPLPNDVALEDGFLPRLEGAGEESAQGEFLEYLTNLRGWLNSTPIEIPFSGALDEGSLDGAVHLYRVVGDELVEAEIDEVLYSENEDGTAVVRVLPRERLLHGQQYAVAVTKDVQGARGEAVVEPLPIFFAASREPLVDEAGRPLIGVLAGDPEQAQTLEGLRLMLAPVFEALEEEGIDRDAVAVAFRWTVTPDAAAAFDPELGRVPLPNTLALDEDGTFPAAGTCFAGESSANGYFDDYLASLSGWPDVTPITLPLTGPIDVSSLTEDAVQLWRLEENNQWQRVEDIVLGYHTEAVDSCTGEVSEAYSIELQPAGGMDIRERYFAFATRDLKGADGRELIPETPIYMGMQPYPVVDEGGASLVASLSDEQAQGIAGVQAVLRPVLEVISEEVGLDYRELATVWSWYTWDDTIVVFDPDAGEIPFPNAFLIGEDGRVAIPIPENADPMTEGILETLNRRTGFSTTAPGWIPLDGQVDPGTVGYESVAMAPEAGFNTKLLGADDYTVRYEREWGHIVVEPSRPLNPEQLHAGIITQDMIGANGRPVQPSPAFVFLRSPYPLWKEGEGSLVYALDDGTAQALEAARQQYEQLFLLALILDGVRFQRERIVNAWAFTTEDPVEAMQEYRAYARELVEERSGSWVWRACDVDESCDDSDPGLVIFDETFTEPGSAGVEVDVSNLWAAQFAAEFENVELSQATQVLEAGEPVGFSVYLPKEVQDGGNCGAPFDVVIAQHGLGADRWQVGLGLANELAAYPNCLATVAMDFPFHGGRSVGASSLHPEGRPANSGQGFLTADLLAANANFSQAIVDLFVLTRVIQGNGGDGLTALFEELNPGEPLFSDRIGYIGVSLGGILGVPFVALEPAIDTAVINGAGGRLTWMLEGDEEGPSTIGGPILDFLSGMGMEPGDFAFIRTMALVQWVADWIDPFAYAPTAISGERRNLEILDDGEPGPVIGSQCEESAECSEFWRCESVVVDGESEKRCVEYLPPVQFLVQMIEGDRTIVNRSTKALAKALEVELDDTTYEGVPHHFMTIRDSADPSFEAGVCAREQAAQWLGSGIKQGLAQAGEEFSPAVCLE